MLMNCAHSLLTCASSEVVYALQIWRRAIVLAIIWLLCCLLELLLVGLPLQDFIVLANHLGLQPSAGRLGV